MLGLFRRLRPEVLRRVDRADEESLRLAEELARRFESSSGP